MAGAGSIIESRAIAAAQLEVPAGTGTRRRVQLLPFGRQKLRDGRGPMELRDRAHAEEVLAATRRMLGSVDFAFDYDHQLVEATKPGVAGRAEASGWVKPDEFHIQDDGIYADVEFTAAAAAKLDAREYRYVSPYFGFDKATGAVTRLFNAALVNVPAFEMRAAAALALENDDMDFGKIATALGLGADAGEDDVLGAITTLQAAPETAIAAALAPIATALVLSDGATSEEVATAASQLRSQAAGAPDPTKWVPIEVLAAANAKLESIATKDGEAAVDAAIAAGKLPPANRAWALDSYKANPEGFAAAMGTMPTILKPGEEEGGGNAGVGLTAEEKDLCASMGWDEAAYAAAKSAEAE